MRTPAILALLALLLCACQQDKAPNADDPLDDLRGQWVIVNYWASWCKPCVKEIPELNRLDADHADISVLGVNYDGLSGDELATQVRELGLAFPVIDDPAARLGTPRPQVLPTSLILNPRGEVVATLVGPQTQESLLKIIGRR
ncbi:MAG: TlpA family protein disulfide reductase [Parahaliea sp.]